MEANKTGGAAFPTLESLSKDRFDDYTAQISQGMTLRDYFAAKALSGICSHHDTWGIASSMEMALETYRIADAMLEARAALALAGEKP